MSVIHPVADFATLVGTYARALRCAAVLIEAPAISAGIDARSASGGASAAAPGRSQGLQTAEVLFTSVVGPCTPDKSQHACSQHTTLPVRGSRNHL